MCIILILKTVVVSMLDGKNRQNVNRALAHVYSLLLSLLFKTEFIDVFYTYTASVVARISVQTVWH